MLIIEGWIKFGAGEVERLADVGRTMIAETHKEPGCLEYAFSQDLADPCKMRISERWVDEAALAAHFASPHMAAFQAALADARREGASVKLYSAELVRSLVGG
jgi:quinol monooxygenase YgiN